MSGRADPASFRRWNCSGRSVYWQWRLSSELGRRAWDQEDRRQLGSGTEKPRVRLVQVCSVCSGDSGSLPLP